LKIGLLLADTAGTVGEPSELPKPLPDMLPEPEELPLAAGELSDAGAVDVGEVDVGAKLAGGTTPPVSAGAVASGHPSLQVTTEVRVRVLVKVTGLLMTADPLVTEDHETIGISNEYGNCSQ
jgi:hypothetical protein